MEKLEKEIVALLTADSRITAKQIAAAMQITEEAAAKAVQIGRASGRDRVSLCG